MMTPARTRPAEVALPAESLAALRDALFAAVGPDTAADALREAGHAAGDALYRLLSSGGAPAELPADRFWSELARLFGSRGWGQLSFTRLHDGVGSLESSDWVEASMSGSAGAPTCHLTTGLLANILGQIAGSEVAVLEAECRSRGDARCRFLFGGEAAVYRVYEQLSAGADTQHALSALE